MSELIGRLGVWLLCVVEKVYYVVRDLIVVLKKYLLDNEIVMEVELKLIEKKIDEVVEDVVEFVDVSLLLGWS